jgi:FkbM family methyltransferase
MILKLPLKLYDGLFTPMGRKSLRYYMKRVAAGRNPDFQKHGTFTYLLKSRNRFVYHRGNHLSELIYLEGAYEPLETLIASKIVRNGDLVLDIGANVGYFTALLDDLVSPAGQVHAFEPGDGTFVNLEATRRLLKLDCAFLHRKAVSDSTGTIDFWLSTKGSDAQQSTVKSAAMGAAVMRKSVEATTVDAVAAELNGQGAGRISFVKCDIEGAEVSMINGARRLIMSQDPPIWLIEHNRQALLEHGAVSLDLLSPFLHYEIYFVPLNWPPSVMVLQRAKKWNGVPEALPDECNLIMLPKHGACKSRVAALHQAGLIEP